MEDPVKPPMSSKVMALLRKQSIDRWLRAHGKFVRPELTKKQKQELKECFDLIDLDGSGAIDCDELLTAFNVLGMHVKRSEVEKMLDDVDEDKSGEVEYPEFVQIMTTKLETQSEEVEEDAKPKTQPLPFQLLAQAYRRKKLMEAVMGGDKGAQQRLRAKADEAEAERLAVLAAIEAENKNQDVFDEKNLRSLSDRKYQKLKELHARKLQADSNIPSYLVDHLDEDVKEALMRVQEEPKLSIKVKTPLTTIKPSASSNGRELKPISVDKQIRDLFKGELRDVSRRREKLRHQPILEQQMIHLKALKSIQLESSSSNKMIEK